MNAYVKTYLPPHEFFRLYPNARNKGKLYGGAAWYPQRGQTMRKVLSAMARHNGHWTYENESCGMDYQQIMLYVA